MARHKLVQPSNHATSNAAEKGAEAMAEFGSEHESEHESGHDGDSRPVGQRKAKTILREGRIGGRELSSAQRGLFGLIAGGGRPTRLRRKR